MECPTVSLQRHACRLINPPHSPKVQCQLTFLSLVCRTLTAVYPELLHPTRPRFSGPLDWRKQWSVPEMAWDLERRLLVIISALQRNQSVAALELSIHAAMVLGWKWQGVHVTALDDSALATTCPDGRGNTQRHGSASTAGSASHKLGLCWDEVAVLNVLSDPDTWPGALLAACLAALPLHSHQRSHHMSARQPSPGYNALPPPLPHA